MTYRVLVLLACGACAIGCRGDKKPARDDAAVAVNPPPVTDGGRPIKPERKQIADAQDKKCVGGDFEACRTLGVMYSEGDGVPEDPRRAAALYAQACNGGNMSGCDNLALVLIDGRGVDKDVVKGAQVWQKACEGGHGLACRNLGMMLRDGRGVAVDYVRAEKLLDKACTSGALFGCTNAGDLDAILAGREGAARYKKMIDHYTLGCNAGDPAACRKIGVAYLEGKALPKSPSAAGVWLERAVAKGDILGARLLGMMLFDGTGVKQDKKRGLELLKAACAKQDEAACKAAALASGAGSGSAGSAAGSGSASGSGAGSATGSAASGSAAR